MQRIFLGLTALFLAAACNTSKPATDTTMASAPAAVKETMNADFRANPPKPGPAPTVELGDFQDFKLDNGLQVVLVENHKLPRISYQLFIDVPAHLEGEYAGTSQLMGDMLRRATADKTKQEIDDAVDFIGASLNTGGSGASGSTITKYKESLLDLMSDVVLNARFPAEEFDKVKSEAEANLQSELGNPGAVASRVQRVLTYGKNHPYGELMTEETLGNITLQQVKDYYNKYFVPNRSYLVMVGDLTRADAESLAMKHFGDWAKKEVMEPEFTMPKQPNGVTVNFVPRAGSVQSNVILSHPVDVKPGTDMAIKANIVNSILGSGFGGRLFQNLREDKAYTYGANSSLRPDRMVGVFSAAADVRNEVTDSAVTEFIKEMRMISSEPVTEKELMRTKAQITGSFGRALESPRQIASYALSTIRYDLDRDYYPTYLKKVAKINQADLLATSKVLMSPNNTNIIVVGDKGVADKLAKFATSGKVNYFDANGNMVDMAANAVSGDVTPKSVLMKYVDAIGGKDAISKIRNYNQTMEANIQGQTIVQTFVKDGGDKFSSQTQMMGMVMADQRYNAGKASVSAQGQKVPENPALTAAMKEQAMLFPVLGLMDKLNDITVSGKEKVNGKSTVVLDVKGDSGTSQFYFDENTGLLVRSIQSQMGQTATTDYGDYKAMNGVQFAQSMKMTGVAPFPIEMKVKEMKVNTDIDQSLFEID